MDIIANQLAHDKGFMDVVIAEEGASVMPANMYNHPYHWRPGIPEEVQSVLRDIEERTADADNAVAAEIRGRLEALRMYGRYTLKAAVRVA